MSYDNTRDIGSMSDEEVMSLSDDELYAMDSNEETNDVEEEIVDEAVEDEIETEDELEDDINEDDIEDEEEVEDEELDEDELEEEDNSEELDDEEDEDESTEDEEEEEDDKEVTSKEDGDDYKSKYDELMAPLKANKKTLNIKTPEELRRLAQMGVGYQAKMAEIKPLRRIGKMLENEGLLDEDKLNYLIDLSKNDPKAIQKLLKDSNIDPLDIDTDNTEEYTPKTYTVGDNQLALSDTLAELEQTESGKEVIKIVGSKWDDDSRKQMTSKPALMSALSEHIDNGMYTKVMDVIDEERAASRIPDGFTDLEIYNYIYGELQKQEGQNSNTPKKAVKVKGKPNKNTDENRTKRRKAASVVRNKKAKATKTQTDTSKMNDEEFEKYFNKTNKF